MDVYSSDADLTDEHTSVEYNYIKNPDIAVCPLCSKFITEVKTRKGSVISIKCPRCKEIVEITI